MLEARSLRIFLQTQLVACVRLWYTWISRKGGDDDDDAAVVIRGQVARCDFTVCLVCFICSWGVDLVMTFIPLIFKTKALSFSLSLVSLALSLSRARLLSGSAA